MPTVFGIPPTDRLPLGLPIVAHAVVVHDEALPFMPTGAAAAAAADPCEGGAPPCAAGDAVMGARW